jgi:hypothetical protein
MGAPDVVDRHYAADLADARRAKRLDRWADWAAANLEDAAGLAAGAGWELSNLPDEYVFWHTAKEPAVNLFSVNRYIIFCALYGCQTPLQQPLTKKLLGM